MSIQKLSIIVADDYPAMREGLVSILRNQKFIDKLHQAANGKQVVSILEKERCNLVLMDIRMSPLDGIETTKIIKGRFPETKVLVISMHYQSRMIELMKSVGASGFLAKDANKDEIIEAILTISKGGTHFTTFVPFDNEHDLFFQISKKDKSTKGEHMREILYLLCIGKISKQIANILNLSPRTVEGYRSELNKHIDVGTLAGLIRYGIDSGILDDEILKIKFKEYSNTYKIVA